MAFLIIRVILGAITALLGTFLAIHPIDFDGMVPWLNGAATAPSPSPFFTPRARPTFGAPHPSDGWDLPPHTPPLPQMSIFVEEAHEDPPPTYLPPPPFEALLQKFVTLLAKVNLKLTLLFNDFVRANPPVLLSKRQVVWMRYFGQSLDERAQRFLRYQLQRYQRRHRLLKKKLDQARWHQCVPAVASAPSPPPTSVLAAFPPPTPAFAVSPVFINVDIEPTAASPPPTPAFSVSPIFINVDTEPVAAPPLTSALVASPPPTPAFTISPIFVNVDTEPIAAPIPQLPPREVSKDTRIVELEEQLAFANQILGALEAEHGPYVKLLETKIARQDKAAELLQARILSLMEAQFKTSSPTPSPTPSPLPSPKLASSAAAPTVRLPPPSPPPPPVAAAPLATPPPPQAPHMATKPVLRPDNPFAAALAASPSYRPPHAFNNPQPQNRPPPQHPRVQPSPGQNINQPGNHRIQSYVPETASRPPRQQQQSRQNQRRPPRQQQQQQQQQQQRQQPTTSGQGNRVHDQASYEAWSREYNAKLDAQREKLGMSKMVRDE